MGCSSDTIDLDVTEQCALNDDYFKTVFEQYTPTKIYKNRYKLSAGLDVSTELCRLVHLYRMNRNYIPHVENTTRTELSSNLSGLLIVCVDECLKLSRKRRTAFKPILYHSSTLEYG